jgi:hypothetical protein
MGPGSSGDYVAFAGLLRCANSGAIRANRTRLGYRLISLLCMRATPQDSWSPMWSKRETLQFTIKLGLQGPAPDSGDSECAASAFHREFRQADRRPRGK